MRSMPLYLVPTDTGFVQLLAQPSRYGYARHDSTIAQLKFILCVQDLESKSKVDEIRVEQIQSSGRVDCMSLAWSADGQTLFAGYTDNLIRVFDVVAL